MKDLLSPFQPNEIIDVSQAVCTPHRSAPLKRGQEFRRKNCLFGSFSELYLVNSPPLAAAFSDNESDRSNR